MPQRATTPNLPGIPTVPRLGGGAVGPFSPDQLSSLRGWYNHDSIVTDNLTVQGWNDASGNGNHLVPISAEPIYSIEVIGPFSAVNFVTLDGITGTPLHRNAALFSSTGATLFVVLMKGAAWGEAGAWLTSHSFTGHHPFSDNAVYDGAFATARKSCGAQVVTIADNWRIFCIRSTANSYQMHIDGQQQFATGTNTYSNGDNFILGCGSYNGVSQNYALEGPMMEALAFNAFLSDADANKVGNYLADRFTLTWADL